jgi:hypothetical protein
MEPTMADEHDIAADRTTEQTRATLALAAFVTPDPAEQAAALIAAATVIIERDVGTAMAEAALAALIEPTVAHWRTRAARMAH